MSATHSTQYLLQAQVDCSVGFHGKKRVFTSNCDRTCRYGVPRGLGLESSAESQHQVIGHTSDIAPIWLIEREAR
ncbi:MAG TPA: hypothetical protein DCF63_16805 [Planctomycetaceae bacterium]|nr:hypothetical protein [Planctomycetaceae bacterium]